MNRFAQLAEDERPFVPPPMMEGRDAGWQKLDPTILTGGRTAPPTMPPDIFGKLWPLVGDLAAGAGAPVDYVGISLLGVVASLIGAKRRVQPLLETPNWIEPCVLWVAAVGDPSANKSPALDAVTDSLRTIELDMVDDHKARMIVFQTQKERARAEHDAWKVEVKAAVKDMAATPPMPDAAIEPEEPQRPRLLVQDATPEAMYDILAGNPNGTLHLRDELAGWLQSFERYSPGGREFWLEANGGRRYVVDRKSNKAGPLIVPYNGVCVLGGIQPDKLSASLLTTVDDGLVARFLWAWPDRIPYQRPSQIADTARLERAYRRLHGLTAPRDASGRTEPVVLRLDDDAAALFVAWIPENDLAIDEAHGLYKGFLGKLRGLVLRLALVAELLAWADGAAAALEPRTISCATLGTVLDFVEEFAKPSALRVFGDAAMPEVERNAAALARHILKTKAERINARDVRRNSGIATLKAAPEVEAATDALIEAGWLRAAPCRSGDTPGRAAKDFLVNPAVRELGRG